MPQEVIIRGSTYSTYDTNARGPVAMPYEYRNNVKRFNEARNDIYGGANLIGDNPLFNWGFRQPYVWTGLKDSDTWKYLKRYDSYEFPIGSTIQDTMRMGKMLISGQGILFLGRQFLLQSQAPFNETSLYNPLSVAQSVLRPASLGFLDRPTRHVQLRGSIFDTLLTTLGFGGGGVRPAPAGTTAAKDNNPFSSNGFLMIPGMPGKNKNPSVLPHENLSEGAGLIRARTANKGMLEFGRKWEVSAGVKPDFLTRLISHFAPGLTPLPRQTGYYRSDEKSADMMLDDIKKSYQISRLNMGYSSETLTVPDGRFYFDTSGKMTQSIFQQPFSYKFKYGKYLTNGTSEKEMLLTDEKQGWKKKLSDLQGKGSKNNITQFNKENFTGQNNIIDVTLGVNGLKNYDKIPSAKTGKYEEIKKNEDVGYGKPPQSGETVSSLNEKLTMLLTNPNNNDNAWVFRGEFNDGAGGRSNVNPPPKARSYATIPDKSNKNSQSKSGEYNNQGYIKNFTSKMPGAINKTKTIDDIGLSAANGDYSVRQAADKINAEGAQSEAPTRNDLVMFFFKDLVNERWIQFRAILSGISISNNAEWENIRYLGRPDQVYIYKGFTQQLSFNFKVYPNNSLELDNIWKKVDYMTGVVQPSNYINDYMTPPFMSLTIGKIYTDQPIIITSISVNVSDDTVWDIDKELPQFIELSVNADILQTKVPNIRNGHYGFSNDVLAPKTESIPGVDSFKSEMTNKMDQMSNVSVLTADQVFTNTTPTAPVDAIFSAGGGQFGGGGAGGGF